MTGQDSLRTVRRAHEGVILDHVTRHGPLSRRELIERSGLSRTTLLALVTDLIDQGALLELRAEPDVPQRGRPTQLIALNPRGGLWMALEMAPARIRVGFANAAHQVIGRGEVAVERDATRRARTRAADRLVETVRAEHDVTLGAVRGIALAVVGLDPAPAASGFGPAGGGSGGGSGGETAAGRDATALTRHVERRYDAPVIVDVNTRLAAYAESSWGVARGVPNVLYLRLSDTVASGVVVGGRLVSGAHGLAGAIGHVPVVRDGRACACGRTGCLETVLGVGNLAATAIEQGVPLAHPGKVYDAIADGDKVVRRLLRTAVARLVDVLLPVVAALDPDAVVVGGSLSAFGAVVDPIRRAVATTFGVGGHLAPEVLVAELDNYAAVDGGLALMLNSRFDPVHLEGRIAGTSLVLDRPTDGAPRSR